MKKPCSTQVRTDRNPVGVEVAGLSKKFGAQLVLKDVNLTVKPGEIFVIMGPSGSGKSVLLRQIAGLDIPTTGTVTINGLNPADPETRDRFALALVFQAGALFNSLSVYDNLALYPLEHQLCTKAEIHDRVIRALKILSLENAAKKFPSELSGGMKKRVAIARALAADPDYIFFDEPTTGLDPIGVYNICNLMQRLQAEGKTTLMVTHDLATAFSTSQRFTFLHQAHMLFEGTQEEMRGSELAEVQQFLLPTKESLFV